MISRQPITNALRELVSVSTSRPCGDHGSPPDGVLPEGYTFVYSIPGGQFEGSFQNPEADATFVYQVTSVGATRTHAQWLAYKVNWALTSRGDSGSFNVTFPALTGMKVINRASGGFSPGVISQGSIYSVPNRYRISVVST